MRRFTICLHRRCLPLAAVAPACPADCSGRGDCDDRGRCHCWPGYSGPGCGLRPGRVGLVGLGLLLLLLLLAVCILVVRTRRGRAQYAVLVERTGHSGEWRATSTELPLPRAFQL